MIEFLLDAAKGMMGGAVGSKLTHHDDENNTRGITDNLGIVGKAAQQKYINSGVDLGDETSDAVPIRSATGNSVRGLLGKAIGLLTSIEASVRSQLTLAKAANTREMRIAEESEIENKDAVKSLQTNDGEKDKEDENRGLTMGTLITGLLIVIPVLAAVLSKNIAAALKDFLPHSVAQAKTEVKQDVQAYKEGFKDVGNKIATGVEELVGTNATGGAISATDFVAAHEGFQRTAKWDVNHYRLGYGSDTRMVNGKVVEVKKGDTTTREEAEADLARRLPQYQKTIQKQIGAGTWSQLDADTQTVLTDIAYNYGSLPRDIRAAAKTKDKEKIAEAITHHYGDNGFVNRARRFDEVSLLRGYNLKGLLARAAKVRGSDIISIHHATRAPKQEHEARHEDKKAEAPHPQKPHGKPIKPKSPRAGPKEALSEQDANGYWWESTHGSDWKLLKAGYEQDIQKPKMIQASVDKAEALDAATKINNNVTNITNNNNTIVASPNKQAVVKDATMPARVPSPSASWGQDYHTYFGTLT